MFRARTSFISAHETLLGSNRLKGTDSINKPNRFDQLLDRLIEFLCFCACLSPFGGSNGCFGLVFVSFGLELMTLWVLFWFLRELSFRGYEDKCLNLHFPLPYIKGP